MSQRAANPCGHAPAPWRPLFRCWGLKEQTVRASATLSAARLKEGFDPWDVLTAGERVLILQKFVRTEASRVVSLLLVAK